MLPRGIRNNNPLNIRRTAKDQWQGLRAQQTDSAFCQFERLEYGWRAHRHPFGSARPLDGTRCSNGDSGKWHRLVRLFRDAERLDARPRGYIIKRGTRFCRVPRLVL